MYKSLQEIKDHAIVLALLHSGGNQSTAAKSLGISRGALRMALERYTLDEPGRSLNEKVFNKYRSIKQSLKGLRADNDTEVL